LLHGWQPDLILTVGDNNYPSGSAETIDANIGQYYAAYIAPYQGNYGAGASENRFFPILGNHDIYTDGGQPFFDYFTLPGNERYYEFQRGPVHFFALNSDPSEVDGVGRSSTQAAWLRQGLADSTARWQIVYMHVPPYSSGIESDIAWMRWPFAEWGADLLLAGHEHFYERLDVDGIPLLINGIGGGAVYPFTEINPRSQVRFNADYGALLVTASEDHLTSEFYTRSGVLIDQLSLP
jgi:hypothetical protein